MARTSALRLAPSKPVDLTQDVRDAAAAVQVAMNHFYEALGRWDARQSVMVPTKPFLTVKEAAERLGISPALVKERVYSHQIRSVRDGRKLLIPQEAIQAYESERDR